MLVLGIDDAGRGPVIGPMVLAGVLLTTEVEKKLKKLGVTDSKKLTEKRREFLAEEIKKVAETFELSLAYPEEIDGTNGTDINLNKLEALKCAEIINKINKGFDKIKVIIDCPSAGINSWRDFLMTKIDNLSNIDLVCEHKADVNHTAVSAASILAKSLRESEMDKIKAKFGDEIGSGYCHDPLTCKFLEKNARIHENEGIFRKSWSTWKKACEKMEQRKLL